MGDFRRDRDNRGGGNRFGGGRGGFGGGNRGGFGGRDRGPVTMHKAVCAKCNAPCEVPFRPTGDKPVYCSACFGGKKEFGGDRGGDRGGFGGDRGDRRDGGSGRSESFAPRSFNGNGSDMSDIKRMIETLTTKVEQLSRTLDTMNGVKPAVVSVAPAKEVKKEAKSEKKVDTGTVKDAVNKAVKKAAAKKGKK